MGTELLSWAIVVPQSAENKEDLLRQFAELLRDRCSGRGVELPHPFVYLWEDITQDTLSGLNEFVDSLLRGVFDFVLCIYNTGFDSDRFPHAREDLPSAERPALYLPLEKIENIAVVVEVLRAMSTCFERRLGSASESVAPASHQNVPRSALRTFMGRTTNSQDDFIFIAKGGVSIATTKEAACNSHRLSYLLGKEGTASASSECVDAGLLLLGVQWLEYSNGSSYGCRCEVDRFTGALNLGSCCKPNVYQARVLDYNQHRWWDLISASAAPMGLMYRALAERLANVAPPSQLKDLFSSDRGSRSSTASWSTVASFFGTIPIPSMLPDEVLLDVVCSYSSRYPNLLWFEEFAAISPQWDDVIGTYESLLTRLFVDTVKIRGCQLQIWLRTSDQQPSSDVSSQPIEYYGQAVNTAAMLHLLAARTLIISMEEHEALEEVLTRVSPEGGLRAVSILLEPPGRLVDANVKQIMRSIGVADTLRVEVKWTREIEALLPHFPRHVSTLEMDLDACRALDDSSLTLLLYFANRIRDFVIERYHSDVLELANRMAKKFSCGIASRLNVLVVPADETPYEREVQTAIALNIRGPDGRRFVAVREGSGMRMIIGDDRAVNGCMSRRKDFNSILPLLNRGSSDFEQLEKAVYATLFSRGSGYSDIGLLLQDIRDDNDIDGDEAARRFAYKSFPDFLRSAEMKAKVNVTTDSCGRTVYEAIPTAELTHHRWAQLKSAVSVAQRSAKDARNEANNARRKMAELERRVQDLELQVAEAQRKIECPYCMDRPIEVVFNCGHGACEVCTEQLTTEERPAPGTSRFSVNGPTIRHPKADPKCSQCRESVNPCRSFYALRS